MFHRVWQNFYHSQQVNWNIKSRKEFNKLRKVEQYMTIYLIRNMDRLVQIKKQVL